MTTPAVTRPSLALAFGLPATACALWTVYAGKDVNWDLLNYHYYLPFELLAGRIQQDFFAASAQSYLNPVGYLPFYAMVSSGWHSVVVSVLLAGAHSLSLALVYLIAWRLFRHLPARERTISSCLATALGAATAVFWATVGTSFLDPLLAPAMLAGLLLLLEEEGRAAVYATLAGALFGTAAALKYSNAIFALAALPLAAAMSGAPVAERVRACLGYVSGAAVAAGVLAGPWLALLMAEFGNPVFPLLNAWFQSPDAPKINLLSERFTPQGIADALTFPFRMALLSRSVYSEIFAPDLRFAALAAVAVALCVTGRRARTPSSGAIGGADWRVICFFAASLLLWLATSANGRYGLVVLLLCGVAVARLTERLLPSGLAHAAMTVLLAVQCGMLVTAAPTRWFVAEPWTQAWLPYAVPERALREPALYVTVEALPMAVIAPFVHPASSFVNFRGLHSLSPDAPRLKALLERHRGRVRALGRGLELVGGRPQDEQLHAYNATLRRLGFQVDAGDCLTIQWRGEAGDDWLSRAANRLAGPQPAHEPLSVASCGLEPIVRGADEILRERQLAELFDRIEAACPVLFRGQTAEMEPLGSGWSRHYPMLDARLEAFGDRVVLNRYRAAIQEDLGQLSEWERRGPRLPDACKRRAGSR